MISTIPVRNPSIQFLVIVVVCLRVSMSTAAAQEHAHPEPTQDPATNETTWSWSTDANAFIGYNYQQRRYADFASWDSQNWAMVAAARRVGRGRLTIDAMFSLEPWTVGRLVYSGNVRLPPAGGTPQLYQTGESYDQIPLVNFQHPHDLVMGLGATYRVPIGRVTYFFGADLVGAPALGPIPFMHRESARSNPQVPLTHHDLDSTHITPGVLRAGLTAGPLTFEGSMFRGAEPDENRFNIEKPALDSWSARIAWHHGPWQAQVSGGLLHEPEWFDPYDITRLTASIGFDGHMGSRPFNATAAWGENREFNGFQNVEDGYLLEWDLRATGASTFYGRGEVAKKHLFGLISHPKGFTHPHAYSDVAALTLGYIRDLPFPATTRLGIGGDVTLYHTSQDLIVYYGGSRSYHLFLRWRPRSSTAHVH
jgi:hypothetical protein